MGLLRAGLPWWMQTGQPEPAQSMAQPAFTPAPQQPTYQPRAQMQAPQSMTPYAHQPLQGGQMPQLGAVPERQRMSFGDQLQETFQSPMFQQGMALMAAGQPGGGGWGEAQDRFQQIAAQEQQRLRQQQEDRRGDQVWRRQQQGWSQEDQQRAAFEQMISTLPPAEQQRARANPQAYMEALAMANAPITPAQERDFGLRERELEASIAARNASLSYQRSQDQWMRRFQGALGAADAGAVAEQSALVNRAVTTVRPIIQEMRAIVQRYPDIMGSWINTQDRTQMARVAGGDPQRLAAMERLAGLATQLTLPQVEALRPATNLDFERIRSTIADPQMSLQGALAFFDSQEQEMDRALSVQGSQGQWINQYGSLSMPNEQGVTWAQATRDAPFMQFNAQSTDSVAGRQQGGSPQRGQIVDGYRFMGGDPANRRNWVRVQGGDNRPQRLNNGVLR